MATRRFEATQRIRVDAETVFDWIADYRNVPKVLEGVTRWEPLSRETAGPGARFAVEMRTLGVSLSNVLELVEWDRPRRLTWRSLSGLVKQNGAWSIVKRRGAVDVTLTIEYKPPIAAIGNLLAGPAEGLARQRLQKALERMAEELEE